MALARFRELSDEDNLSLESFPIRNERQEIFAIRHPYDYIRGDITSNNSQFAFNADVRNNFLHLQFDQHAWDHRKSCFKKEDECRALLPQPIQSNWDVEFDEENATEWHMIDRRPKRVTPFTVLPQQNFGDQYLNVHNRIISNLFACNNNIQIGDLAHLFYNTLYSSKSTQEDDTKSFLRVSADFAKRIQREIERRSQHNKNFNNDKSDPEFLEGLFRLLNGVQAHMFLQC